jgi:hypothetical protein
MQKTFLQQKNNSPQKKISIGAKFRSTVMWKQGDWQNPIDQLNQRLARECFLVAGSPLSSPIELTVDQFAILAGGDAALTKAREDNDMPRFRLILKQYEEKAMEFIQRQRASQQ